MAHFGAIVGRYCPLGFWGLLTCRRSASLLLLGFFALLSVIPPAPSALTPVWFLLGLFERMALLVVLRSALQFHRRCVFAASTLLAAFPACAPLLVTRAFRRSSRR